MLFLIGISKLDSFVFFYKIPWKCIEIKISKYDQIGISGLDCICVMAK